MTITMNSNALFRCENDNTLIITDAYTEGGTTYNIVLEGEGLKQKYAEHLHDNRFLLIPVIQQIFLNVVSSTQHYLTEKGQQVVPASSLVFDYQPIAGKRGPVASDVQVFDRTGKLLQASGHAIRLLETASLVGGPSNIVGEIDHLAGCLYQKSILNIASRGDAKKESVEPSDGSNSAGRKAPVKQDGSGFAAPETEEERKRREALEQKTRERRPIAQLGEEEKDEIEPSDLGAMGGRGAEDLLGAFDELDARARSDISDEKNG